jgi:hypothetical protein
MNYAVVVILLSILYIQYIDNSRLSHDIPSSLWNNSRDTCLLRMEYSKVIAHFFVSGNATFINRPDIMFRSELTSECWLLDSSSEEIFFACTRLQLHLNEKILHSCSKVISFIPFFRCPRGGSYRRMCFSTAGYQFLGYTFISKAIPSTDSDTFDPLNSFMT